MHFFYLVQYFITLSTTAKLKALNTRNVFYVKCVPSNTTQSLLPDP